MGKALLSGESSEGVAGWLNEAFAYALGDDRHISRSAACTALNRKGTWDALELLFSKEEINTMRRLRKARQGTGTMPPPLKTPDNVIIFGNPAPSTGSTPPGATSLPYEAPGLATILTIGAHMCKWPIGDPEAEGFTFCGRSTVGSKSPSYCKEHRQVAYAPQATRKKKPKAVIDDLPIFSRVN